MLGNTSSLSCPGNLDIDRDRAVFFLSFFLPMSSLKSGTGSKGETARSSGVRRYDPLFPASPLPPDPLRDFFELSDDINCTLIATTIKSTK